MCLGNQLKDATAMLAKVGFGLKHFALDNEYLHFRLYLYAGNINSFKTQNKQDSRLTFIPGPLTKAAFCVPTCAQLFVLS